MCIEQSSLAKICKTQTIVIYITFCDAVQVVSIPKCRFFSLCARKVFLQKGKTFATWSQSGKPDWPKQPN